MRFSELSKSNQHLLTLCREINFGTLSEINVVDGELHTTAQSRKCTHVKLDKAGASRTAAQYDFTLCDSQEQLILELRTLGNGRIKSIEIRDGRPVSVNIEEVVAAF